MPYSADIKAEVKRLFVDEGKSPSEISQIMGGNPVPQTLYNWASAVGKGGKTWWDLREERADQLYEAAQPQHMARRVMEKIELLLAQPGFDSSRADSLSKLSKYLKEFIDERHQVAMMFQTMTELATYLRENHPERLTPELVQAFRHFKNDVRSRVQ